MPVRRWSQCNYKAKWDFVIGSLKQTILLKSINAWRPRQCLFVRLAACGHTIHDVWPQMIESKHTCFRWYTQRENPFTRSLTYRHTSIFFFLKHQQCDYSLMPFMPQRNMIPLPAQSCEKHSRSGPFVLLQKCENVDLLCITNAFFNPIHGPAQWWILSQDLSLGFTTALLFLFQQ